MMILQPHQVDDLHKNHNYTPGELARLDKMLAKQDAIWKHAAAKADQPRHPTSGQFVAADPLEARRKAIAQQVEANKAAAAPVLDATAKLEKMALAHAVAVKSAYGVTLEPHRALDYVRNTPEGAALVGSQKSGYAAARDQYVARAAVQNGVEPLNKSVAGLDPTKLIDVTKHDGEAPVGWSPNVRLTPAAGDAYKAGYLARCGTSRDELAKRDAELAKSAGRGVDRRDAQAAEIAERRGYADAFAQRCTPPAVKASTTASLPKFDESAPFGAIVRRPEPK
jgi:hypothetical protein